MPVLFRPVPKTSFPARSSKEPDRLYGHTMHSPLRPYKEVAVVLLLHFGRAEFHRQTLRSTRLALIHNQSLWNASETQSLSMKPD